MRILQLCLLCLASRLSIYAEDIRLDRPDHLADWKIEYGDWQIADGQLLQPDATRSRTIIWRPSKAYGDLDVSVRFFAYPDGEGVKAAGLVYKAASPEEYYYIHYDLKNHQVVWVRSAPGNEWTEARRHRPYDIAPETWHSARVVVKGNKHDVYLNGKLLFSETDDTHATGVIGLRAGQGKIAFKDLRIVGAPAKLGKSFVLPEPKFHEVCTDAGAGAYEAFPDVCRSKSGDLLCVFYAGYGHVSVPREDLPNGARLSMVRSKDEGKTWSAAETVIDSPIDDRDPSIAQLSDGRLVVTYMSYDPKRRPATHEVFLLWSSDDGKTWGAPQPIDTPLKGNEAVSEPVRELPDGTLLLPLYGALEPGQKDSTVVMRSHDGGKTWPEHTLVRLPAEHLHEPSVVRLPSLLDWLPPEVPPDHWAAESVALLYRMGVLEGYPPEARDHTAGLPPTRSSGSAPPGKLLMFIRPRMHLCESTDNGKSWSAPQPMAIPGHAPYPLLTSKGVLLLAFRHPPTRSTSMIYSRDFGKTWSDLILLDKVIGGYPSMVELRDGRVLVVYYTEGHGSDIRSVLVRADEDGVEVVGREHARP